MTSYILGISAFYHDSAACLLRNGEILAAAQEERFSRKKHDHRFPALAIEYCLSEAEISTEDLTHVAFYDKPWLKFERLLETYLMVAPAGLPSFIKSMPLWLKEKLWMGETIKKEIGFSDELFFPEHHQSHAASAFFPSPFERAAILTIDGVGEWATATWGTGSDNKIDLQFELRFPHSLGLLYSAFTYYTGFRVNSGEYKIMGLAPYGEPRYVQAILDNLIDLKDDGSFRMNMKYFNYCQGLTMTSSAFHELFEGPPREPESKISQREMDLARSIQAVSEEVILRMARHVRKETSEKNLCLAGGVALNCVANGRILEERIFENIWIQPAAGDAGGALGAVMFVWHQVLENSRTPSAAAQKGSYLGPAFRSETISHWLNRDNIPYNRVNDEKERYSLLADLLASGKVIGWFNGRMEFGPRALGGRSIVGDARNSEMQTKMNLKIKYRESFRPFAPSVLAEDASDYFELDVESPYMLLVAPVHEDRKVALAEADQELFGIEKLKVRRSDIPAVTHVDYSARVQTVDGKFNKAFYDLLSTFKEKTGSAVLINTSFNVRGEPIVCTPEDAFNCFMNTEMDVLVLEDLVLYKEEQPANLNLSKQLPDHVWD
ncbi:MAG: carbamoyltransferase [Bacteroidetes bacterium]|nr:carbamoyltransferase [Bacteroidota bacterium]